MVTWTGLALRFSCMILLCNASTQLGVTEEQDGFDWRGSASLMLEMQNEDFCSAFGEEEGAHDASGMASRKSVDRQGQIERCARLKSRLAQSTLSSKLEVLAREGRIESWSCETWKQILSPQYGYPHLALMLAPNPQDNKIRSKCDQSDTYYRSALRHLLPTYRGTDTLSSAELHPMKSAWEREVQLMVHGESMLSWGMPDPRDANWSHRPVIFETWKDGMAWQHFNAVDKLFFSKNFSSFAPFFGGGGCLFSNACLHSEKVGIFSPPPPLVLFYRYFNSFSSYFLPIYIVRVLSCNLSLQYHHSSFLTFHQLE